MQFRMAPRISPQKDAMHHVITKTDKTGKLEVKFINAVKGRGVFATHPFNKGDFIVEYRGDMINEKECERRKRVYHHSCATFMFAFRWKEKIWCIDASREDGSLGRFVNDEHRCPNSKMKKIDVNGVPHLCLFALHNIQEGEEITYDYGGNDCPWRTKSPTDGLHMDAVEQGNPVTLPEIQTDDASGLCSSFLQSPTDGLHMDAVEQGNPVTLPEIQTDDASGLCSSFLQSPTDGLHMDAVEQGNPVTLPEIQTDDASGLCSSFLQSPTDGLHMDAVEQGNPVTLPEIQTDDASELCSSFLQSPTDGLHMDAVEQGNPVTLPEIQTDDASGLCSSFLQSPTDGLHMDAVEQGNPVTLPEIQTDDASGLCSSFLQSPTDGLHMDAVEQGNPVTLPEIQTDDASELCSSFLQSPTDGLHMDAVEQGNPVTLPEIQTDDASGLCSSFLQSPTDGLHMDAVEQGNPVTLPEIQTDDASGLCSSFLQSPTDGLHMDAVEQGNPVTLPEIQTDDASELCSSFLQSPTDGLHMDAVEQGNPVTLPEIQTDDASGLCSSFLQSPTDGLHMDAVEQGNPVTLPEIQTDDASGLCSSFLQSPTDGLHMDAVEQGNPVTLPEIQTDDASGLCSSFLQSPTDGLHMDAVEQGNPVTLPEIQTDDASGLCSSFLQSPTDGLHMDAVEQGNPVTLPEIQTDDASGLCSSFLQSPKDRVRMNAVEGHPLTLPVPWTDKASESHITSSSELVMHPDDEIFVPRLRRTKSVILQDLNLEDPDQLYDSTSSSDLYIPDTSSESDADSDCSFRTPGREKRPKLDDLPNVSNPLNEEICDSTTSISNYPLSDIPDDLGAEEEPSSSMNDNDIVVTACQKRGGKRVYDKKHYCLYCNKPYAKMARHLERAHINKCDVAKALSFPKGSRERKKHLDFIRNKGNFAHNAAVMEAGSGKLVASKRPSAEIQGKDFMHCAYCQGLYKRNVLWRHVGTCSLKPGTVTKKPGKNRVQALCAFTGPVPSHISKHLWKVISAMNPDEITNIIKSDTVIIDLGQHLLNKGGTSAKSQQYVREKMREMGRLVHQARKVTTLKKMEDLINPKKYPETVKAVKATCGYDDEENKFSVPSLANKLGNTLVKVSKLLKAQGLITDDKELVKKASEFLEVHREKWNEMISATALRNIREAKWNVPTLMPFTEDVQKLHTHLDKVQEEWFSLLSANPSTKAWSELSKTCLTQIILFNRRREGEVSSMPLSAFEKRDLSDSHEDVDWALSEVEKKLCRHFTRIIIRGKRGRPVPVLLTPKMLCALELLVKQRDASGVLKGNIYLFARPDALTHFRGSDCLRNFSKICGAKCPESLTSTRLRKHAATLSTVLNMTDTEMDQLANFLGHDIRIHREFYRLPEKTLQLAKVSKVLMALEQGRLAEFHGKNLDEIGIDPDDEVPITEEGRINEENDLFAVDEPTTEGSFASNDRNELPSKSPERSKGPSMDETPSSFTAPKSNLKGKSDKKRKEPWTKSEVQAVERQMSIFIKSCRVPAKADCEKCLAAEGEALKNRDWQHLKFYVYNRITAYKRKIKCL
ncbi:uncharacterized protein LOC105358446 isoform X3 [Oryzias latipes]